MAVSQVQAFGWSGPGLPWGNAKTDRRQIRPGLLDEAGGGIDPAIPVKDSFRLSRRALGAQATGRLNGVALVLGVAVCLLGLLRSSAAAARLRSVAADAPLASRRPP